MPETPTAWHILTGEYPPQPGGVSDYTRLVARGLAAAGDPVDVWTPEFAGRHPDDDGVVVHRLPDRFGPRSLRQLTRDLDRLPGPRRLLVQYVPHAFGWKGGNVPFCAWLRVRRRDSIWIMFHEVMFTARRGQGLARNALAAVNHLMASLVAGAAQRAFVSIPLWRRFVEPMVRPGTAITWLPVPSGIPVVRDAAATCAIRARAADGHALVGHFGTYGANIRPLLERSLAALAAQSECRILLLGDASEAARANLIASNPSLADRVIATGRLGPAALSHHIAACDVMLQPYPDGVSSRRTSVMAALAHGRPIATTTGWLTESLWGDSEAVALAPADDPDALADHAAALLRDAVTRQELASRAAALYDERFDLRHTVAALRS
jgi:glycosyltransferase involved in cell wall biosynthesis